MPHSNVKNRADLSTTISRMILITRGRKTGKPHKVELTGVTYSGKVYFSRHKPNSDWYLNATANSDVAVQFDNRLIAGTAHVVCDPKLLQHISELKYPGEKRANEKRVAIEVELITSSEFRN